MTITHKSTTYLIQKEMAVTNDSQEKMYAVKRLNGKRSYVMVIFKSGEVLVA